MAEIKISALPTGTPEGTDLTPATDTTDTSSAASGTTKKYTRSSELNFTLNALSLTSYDAVRLATTGALTAAYANGALGVGATLTNSGAQAALSLDGVAVAVSDRVLIKNQASALQNGIYTVTDIGSGATNWVLTRATDYDQAAEVVQYGVVLVNQGTVNAGLLYQETGAGPFTMGTTSITFAVFTMQSLSIPVALSEGGTSASLTANNGGIFYSTATAGAILSGTVTATQMLQSGASSTPAWSTSTWPATTTINQVLYSSAANTVGGITAATGGVLVSDSSDVPAWLANPVATGRILSSVSGDAPVWTAAAFPVTSGTLNHLLRSDGTNWVETTTVTIDATDVASGFTQLNVDNLRLDGNSITSTDAAGNINITPDTTGDLVLDGLNWPQADGAANTFLFTDGAAQLAFTTATFPTTSGSTGTILRSNGTNWVNSTSTFADTYGASELLYSNGANTVAGLAAVNDAVLGSSATGVPTWRALTDGQILIGSSAGAPLAASITAGVGITITPGPNTITVDATGGGMAWFIDATGTIAAAVNSGYVCTAAGATTATLPATAPLGAVVALEGLGAGGWVLTANGGQTIQIGTGVTSAGGTLTSAAATDNVYVTCIVANTTWRVRSTNSAGLTIA